VDPEGQVTYFLPINSTLTTPIRQSKTLQHAVIEYKKRYNRDPPKGFDRWFQFCKERGVKIIDDVSTYG
jgi:hypothetical protein